MRFFLLFLVALSLGFVAEGKVWAVIDTFATNVPPLFQSVDQQDYSPPYTWYSPYGEASGTPPAVSFIDTTDCLGGQRDLILGYQTDSASGSLAVMGVSQRAASIGFPLEYDGGAYFQWDGIDNAGTQNPFPGANLNAQPGIGSGGNPFGLSGGRMDFTFGGRAQGITMTVLADHEVFYYYDALDSFGTKYTLQNLVIPINDQTPVVLNVTFSDPRWNVTAGTSAFSWTNVVAFQVRALTFSDETGFSQAVDTSFKFLNITGYEIAGFVVVDCLCTGDNTNPQAGITMQLFGSTNTVLNTTVTDVNGQFAFYGYAPGSYRVCVDSSVNRCSNSPQCVSFFQDNDIDVPAIRFAATVTTTLTIPADRTLECGACTTPDCLGYANVTSCNGFQQLTTWNDTQTTSGCTTTIRRTWTSPDNTRSGTQTITVRDTQAPVITNPAQNLTQPCGSTSITIDQWLSTQAGATATDCSLFSWTNNYQNNGPVQCGAVTVIFTARDVCGLTTPTTATFSILDNQPPTVSPASDDSAECDTKGQTDSQKFTTWLNNRGGASATDTCDTSVASSNNNTGVLTSGCDNRRTVQFTFSDDCGNSDFTIATFFIRDTTAPTITRQAADASGSCTGNSSGALTTYLNNHGGATATDNCISNDANLVWTNDYVDGSITGGCSGGVPVTFTVTDPCGLFARTTSSFSISDNTPPTITRQASPVLQECGSGADLQTSYNNWLNSNGGANATDDCTAVTWTNNGTGVTPENGCLNVYTVVFSARDACNAQAATTTSTFTVRDTTAPRFTTNPTNQQAECNSGVTDSFNAWLSTAGGAVGSDACGSTTITNDYNGTSPSLGCNVVTPVRFTVRDSCGLSSAPFTANFTVTDTTPPTIDVQAQPAAVECNSTTNQQAYSTFLSTRGGAQASDICSSTVSWSNNGTGTISSGCNVVRYVQFTATDGCGRQASTVTTFTVQDTTAPVLTRAAADATAECNGNTGNSAAFNSWRSSHGGATATDNCGGVTWTDNFTGFSNDSTACTSSATVTFTAADPCGFTVSTVATYSVTDTVGPSISTPAQNQVVQCDGTGNNNQFQTFLDNHGGAVAVDACTGSTSLTWTNSIASSPQGCGTSQVTFTVADPCGKFAQTTASFTVSDSTNPTFSTAPTSPRVECDGNGNTNEYQQWVSTYGGAVAGDVCATVVSLSSNAPANGPVGCGVVPATITATDSCNNAAQVTASFTVIDTQPPVFTQQASDLSVECDGTSNQATLNNWLSTYGGAIATDVCYGSQSLSWTNNYTTIAQSGCNRSARVQFTVTDPCGQRGTTVATFAITDTTAPVITQQANSTVLECNLGTNAQSINTYVASRGGATATDTCSGVTWTNDYSASNPPIACQSPVPVTFRATDACGNFAVTTGSIAIVDSDGPRFVSFPADIRLNCSDSSDSSVTGFPTVSDVCDNDVDIVQSDSTTINPDERLCPGDTIITRTFTATDACGNSISRAQTITQGIPVGNCIPTPCPPCNQTQFCCESSLVSPACIPVECNPVPCSSVECNPVPCLPVTCDGTPPVYTDDDDEVPPSPTPQNPDCEPIYIYVFDDEDNNSDTQVQQPRSSSDASMLGFSLFALFLVLVVLF